MQVTNSNLKIYEFKEFNIILKKLKENKLTCSYCDELINPNSDLTFQFFDNKVKSRFTPVCELCKIEFMKMFLEGDLL